MDPQAVKAQDMQMNKKRFVKDLKKLIEQSDLILEVLDARDPENCRNKEMETMSTE